MFRQTRWASRRSSALHCFNGGRNICSAKPSSHNRGRRRPQCFNGGRNICSAKPRKRALASFKSSRFNGGRNICSAKPVNSKPMTLKQWRLQWRAEHMFRQTCVAARDALWCHLASMEGGTYVPPNLTPSSSRSWHQSSFNGGRNICSAKRASESASCHRRRASMEGGTYVPPNRREGRASEPDASASMEGGTYVPPNPTFSIRTSGNGFPLQWRAEHMFRQTRQRPSRAGW